MRTSLLLLVLASLLAGGCRSTPLPGTGGVEVTRVRVYPWTDSIARSGLPRPPGMLPRDDTLGIPPLAALHRTGKTPLQVFPWPDYVTGEEKRRIEDALHRALEVGGREGQDAEDYLAGIDAYPTPGTSFRAVGRLISEFKHLVDRFGADNPEGLSRLMVIDRILRRIDGLQERSFDDLLGIRAQTTEGHARQVMRSWTWWYANRGWRNRQRPWDPWEDLGDELEEPPTPTRR